jgi:2-keto-3-deoxy-L-rhamnonate aldolase RhmA
LEKYGKELAGVLIGPYDASIMIGTPLDILSDAMTDYIRKVFEICNDYGIACGSFVDGPALIARYRDLGANVYWTGTDIGMLCTGFKITCDTFQEEIK